MKYVYAILSRTNTGVAKVIRFFTKYELNHASFSLDGDISHMYAFGRKKSKPALNGGFIVETPGRCCAGDLDMRVKVFRFKVSDKNYSRMLNEIELLKKKGDTCTYNFFGALGYLFGKEVNIPYSYTCIEFVEHILGIKKKMKIDEFDKFFDRCAIYDGSYKEYLHLPEYTEPDKNFFKKDSIVKRTRLVAGHFKRIFKSARSRRKVK